MINQATSMTEPRDKDILPWELSINHLQYRKLFPLNPLPDFLTTFRLAAKGMTVQDWYLVSGKLMQMH